MFFRAIVAAFLFVVAASACGPGGDGTSPADTGTGEAAGGLPSSDHVHALRATDDGELLLGLHGALWRSPDGREWEQLGLEGQDAMALGVAKDGEPLLVGGHDVLVRSTDGGETFEALSPEQLPSLDVHALAQAPSDPSIVYAYVVGAGVFRSDDAGDSWEPATPVGDALPGDLSAMAVDPNDPDVVLVGSGSQGVFRSDDGGRTFSRTTDYGTIGLGFAEDGTVAAATYRGVDVSDDGGESWENAAPAGDFDGQPFAVAIGDDGAIWVMTEEPRVLFRSTDGGAAFEEVARA
ncbi:MAG: hypothetical protein KY461_02140 [Actinobacteria bacterium]|nr:hypothetical protein [Actinomycetota bacterium]